MDSFFDRALLAARRLGASDVHLKPGLAPILRIAGELRTLSDVPPLSREFLHSLGLSLLNDRRRETLERTGDVVVALATSNGGRQRAHLFHHRGGLSLALRLIPPEVPALDTLGLPVEVRQLTEPGAGLVIVAAGPGQGKTTTLAALIDDLTARRPCRVLTIEDPVEYLLKDRRGVVVQREVGTDVPSTAAALRAVSRQDVDLLVVGDLGDPDAGRLAIEAAENGRLVLAGMVATDVGQVVQRLTAPGEDDASVSRARVAAALQGVIVQRLVSAAGGKGRRPAGTLLRVGPEARARLGDETVPPGAPELPGSLAFEPPAEPSKKRRGNESPAAVEDDAAGD
ncbi:MAG TPA: ATPase, T2SS/T4P/T4SS family [Polyangia bacterium]|jgi:twitching motility protein PilT|nr:ATPase, T2SS/T4P/T4SS family [Polyangia bacterium]